MGIKQIPRAAAASLICALIFSICLSSGAYASGYYSPMPASLSRGTAEKYTLPKDIIDEKTKEMLKIGDTAVTGVRPVIFGKLSAAFQAELQNAVDVAYKLLLEDLPESVRRVELSYDEIADGNVVSILMYAKKQSDIAERTVISINFDADGARLLNIADIAGANAPKIINKLIASDARRTPGKYNNSFPPITEYNDFYVSGGRLVLVFDDNEISPRRGELFEFSLALERVNNYEVSKDEYYSATGYNIKMIRLSQIAAAFGYDLAWDAENLKIAVTRNGSKIVTLTIGVNNYSANPSGRHKLETAPELYENRTYLPLTFYEEILGLSVSTGADGDILFTEYREYSK